MANDADFKRAAQAVQDGHATKEQIELNNRMAKNAGNGLPAQARDAQKGELKK